MTIPKWTGGAPVELGFEPSGSTSEILQQFTDNGFRPFTQFGEGAIGPLIRLYECTPTEDGNTSSNQWIGEIDAGEFTAYVLLENFSQLGEFMALGSRMLTWWELGEVDIPEAIEAIAQRLTGRMK